MTPSVRKSLELLDPPKESWTLSPAIQQDSILVSVEEEEVREA
jgi:hypothetical protein